MEHINKIVQFLNQSGAISGAEIGRALGVSRVAVQKKMQSLVENGMPINASPGVGYRLEEGVILLDAARIESLFIPTVAEKVRSIEVMQSIESTNNYLLGQNFCNAGSRVCMAESQTSGRGRRGNDWMSTPYQNIMLSVSWSFDHWPSTITGLGLAVGLMVAEYLASHHKVNAKIKWPNDILVNNKKLAGILVDVAGESSGACNIVIGLGLNVNQANWSTEIGYDWVDLKSLGVTIDRNVLAADLISILVAMLSSYGKTGFSPLVSRWNSLSSYGGKNVVVSIGDDSFSGKMQGVDESGALLICVDGEVVRIEDSTARIRMVSG
ncbi:MAG: biotin--[acetyl-CoA-carboxylase] ligase [Gammaproteobacteria bacterium]|nr:biotin--[acetyl-CoA-carboxylase] ligase [Gammaproteobacteria bacterium]